MNEKKTLIGYFLLKKPSFSRIFDILFYNNLILNGRDLAKKIDTTPQYISQLRREDKIPTLKLVNKIQDLVVKDTSLNIYEDDVNKKTTKYYEPIQITRTVNEKKEEYGTSNDLAQARIINVPLIHNYAYTGYLSGWGDTEFIDQQPYLVFVDDQLSYGDCMAFEVKGDSMNDGTERSILEKDIVVCREIDHSFWKFQLTHKSSYYLIVHKLLGIIVKQIVHHETETGEIVAHSINDFYKDQKVNLDEVIKLFKVIKIIRNI